MGYLNEVMAKVETFKAENQTLIQGKTEAQIISIMMDSGKLSPFEAKMLENSSVFGNTSSSAKQDSFQLKNGDSIQNFKNQFDKSSPLYELGNQMGKIQTNYNNMSEDEKTQTSMELQENLEKGFKELEKKGTISKDTLARCKEDFSNKDMNGVLKNIVNYFRESTIKEIGKDAIHVIGTILATIPCTSCTRLEATADAGAAAEAEVVVPTKRDTTITNIPITSEVQDSLNHYIEDILDVPDEGSSVSTGKILSNMEARHNWEYDKRGRLILDAPLNELNNYVVTFKHIVDSDTSEVTANLVKKGQVYQKDGQTTSEKIVLAKKDGTIIDENPSGVLLDEKGQQEILHPEGEDQLITYQKATQGENKGKYVYKGIAEPGYLDKEQMGNNVAITDELSGGTTFHYTQINGEKVKVNKEITTITGGSDGEKTFVKYSATNAKGEVVRTESYVVVDGKEIPIEE